ncbi:hypothetical protein GUJ93_ZPchr0009g664 [Zizania palustris]|uniref:Peptidase M3A/M3B catalytic domain-containing protein n=1 Tax=Zizania palustris TaxID=103762 RepID=A0A8J5V3C7_ZIZPA|nr:hypothetical protein GUJ93_ZPchr0009g664 [Zizania palustris]
MVNLEVLEAQFLDRTVEAKDLSLEDLSTWSSIGRSPSPNLASLLTFPNLPFALTPPPPPLPAPPASAASPRPAASTRLRPSGLRPHRPVGLRPPRPAGLRRLRPPRPAALRRLRPPKPRRPPPPPLASVPPASARIARSASVRLRNRCVETVFHEFGHALQHMLTKQDEGFVAGIRGIEWDAVELPSQFMENWCYHKNTLLSIAKHYETGELLPEEIYEKLVAAKNFRAGTFSLRQFSGASGSLKNSFLRN